MRHLIAGNWKMNGLAASLEEAVLIAEGAEALKGRVDAMLCPPATLIAQMRWRTAKSTAPHRRAGLPCRKPPAPIPETFPPRC